VKRLLIAYFIGNISGKKCQNPFMCATLLQAKSGTFFETGCTLDYYYGSFIRPIVKNRVSWSVSRSVTLVNPAKKLNRSRCCLG